MVMVMEENTESTREERRVIRSHYRRIEKRMIEGKDEIGDAASSQKFINIINEVENIHQYVNNPREQVADAETLLGLTDILVTSVKSHNAAGITPAQFVSCLIRTFGQHKKWKGTSDNTCDVSWEHIGSYVSPIFMTGAGLGTMIGPMENKVKQRKTYIRRKRARPEKKILPEKLENKVEVTNTDNNIHVMFEVLKRKKKVEVESLILNRSSFAETVENLFSLSFLVKDGRVQIGVDANGAQVVVPRNGPSAKQIIAGVAKNHHFMFRLDFDDWKLMKKSVPDGDELMPQRYIFDLMPCSTKSFENDLDIPEGIPIDPQFVRVDAPVVNELSRTCMAVPREYTTSK